MTAPAEPSGTHAPAGVLAGHGGPWPPVPMMALTLATGAVDALGFMTLGGVFTSVMTANLALLGVSVGSLSWGLAGHVLTAFAAFVGGVLAGGALSSRGPAGEGRALGLELLLLCGLLAGWTASSGRPHGAAQTALLAVAALAMGCQSGAVRVAAPDLSTTYMTGALTGVLTRLVTRGALQRDGLVLVGMLPVGAAASACLVTWAGPAAPVLPAVVVAGVAAYARAARRGAAGG